MNFNFNVYRTTISYCYPMNILNGQQLKFLLNILNRQQLKALLWQDDNMTLKLDFMQYPEILMQTPIQTTPVHTSIDIWS